MREGWGISLEAGQHPRRVHRHTLRVCGVLGFSANGLWVRPRLDARFLSRSSVTLMAASPTSHSTVMQTPERGRYRGLLNLFMLKLFVILFGGGGRRGGAHPRGARSGYS
jgi:hypothetical protein